MKLRSIFLCITCSGIVSLTYSQERITLAQYIEQYKVLAIEEMETYRIPASITLAQGILESDCGNSPLAREANNHFGIKCHKGWTGATYHQDDDAPDECFRKYRKAEESYRDHSLFLTTRDRYKLLFDLVITDYKGWAHGLKQAGYATNPRYPELLIKIVEENGLDAFDVVSGRQSLVVGQEDRIDSATTTFNIQPSTSPPDDFALAGRGGNDRIIFKNNEVKFVLARKGDTYRKIAGEFGIYTWQVEKYNEAGKNSKLKAGDKVYLEKKKGSAEAKSHVVRAGETIRSVSQDYGVRLKALCRKNRIKDKDKIREGEVLLLK